jgi:hypothetical protein
MVEAVERSQALLKSVEFLPTGTVDCEAMGSIMMTSIKICYKVLGRYGGGLPECGNKARREFVKLFVRDGSSGVQ